MLLHTHSKALNPSWRRVLAYILFVVTSSMAPALYATSSTRIDVISSQVVRPTGVAITKSGAVWISNQGNCYLMGLSGCTTNASVILISDQGNRTFTGFASPAGIAVDSKGNAWVANYGGNNVQHLNASNGSVDVVLSDPNLQLINGPTSVAVDSNDNVWIANRVTQVISGYSSTGKFLGYLQVDMNIFALAFDDQDHLWIADTQNNAIYCPRLGVSFKLHKNTAPHALAIDHLGHVWVANYNLSSVTEYSPKGFAISVVKAGVRFPTGVNFDVEGNLYISNFSNNNVGVYQINR